MTWVVLLPALNAVLPMREQWQAGLRALRSGNAGAACALFEEFAHWYGDETALRDPAFRESYLRHRALAAAAANDYRAARGFIDTWLGEFPAYPKYRAFLRFNAAELSMALGEPATALQHWRQFLADHPDLPEANLVRWRMAEFAIADNDNASAREQFAQILASPTLSGTGRLLASYALAYLALSEDRIEETMAIIATQAAESGLQIARLWRAVMAPSLLDRLLREERFAQAIQVNDWLEPTSAQLANLASLRASLRSHQQAARQAGDLRRTTWNAHWQGQLDRLGQAANQPLDDAAEWTLLFTLRLETLLRTGHEAWAHILADALIDPRAGVPQAVRGVAYPAGIRALISMRRFTEADNWAQEFLKAFPDDPALPEILFLQARLAAETGKPDMAIRRCREVVATYPQHRACLAWQLQLATWLLQAGMAADALQMYQEIATKAPVAWTPFLNIQMALCCKARQDFAEAQRLLAAASSHPQATADLREQASVQLLMLLLETADLAGFSAHHRQYQQNFPYGRQRGVATHLFAIFSERTGDLAAALASYQQLASDQHAELALLARGHISRILTAERRWTELQDHSLRWIARGPQLQEPVPEQPFVDLQAVARSAPSVPVDTETLSRWHSALLAGEAWLPAGAFLDWLESVWPDASASLNGASLSFDAWLRALAQHSMAQGQLSAYANLELHLSVHLRRNNRIDAADTACLRLLQAVDPGQLSEQPRIQASLVALKYDFPGAADWLEECLLLYPDSDLRPVALHAIAHHAAARYDWDSAIARLAEIRLRWADSPLWQSSLLTEAGWLLQRQQTAAALAVLDELLDGPALPPQLAAAALLERGRACLALGDEHRARTTLQRLLILYPHFEHIGASARSLLSSIETTSKPTEHDDPSAKS